MGTDVTIKVPYSFNLSKNARGGWSQSSGPYVRKEVRQIEIGLIEEFRQTGPWYTTKTWLDIFVQMPTRRSDAINVLDTVADAVKKGIGVDDKWFSIYRLDWEIEKVDPIVSIRVFQNEDFHSRYCNTCKKAKPLTSEEFHNRRTDPSGLSLVCKPCAQETNNQRYKDGKRKNK